MNVGFDFLSHIFLFLFMMHTDAYDEDTTSEIADKIPAPAAASGKFRLFFFLVLDVSIELEAIP